MSKISGKLEIDIFKHLQFDEKSSVNQLEILVLAHFAILKELLGGYNVIKEYSNRIPARGFHFEKIDSYCNQLLYLVKHEDTFHAKGTVSIMFNDKHYYLKVPDHMRNGLDRLILYADTMGADANAI